MAGFASMGTPCVALAVLAAGLGGCMQTSTYGTGERPGVAMFTEVMGGLGKEEEEPIEYSPRAPLVVPPQTATAGLPEPVDVASSSEVDWPDGPEGPGGPRFGDNNPVDDVNSAEYRRLRPLAALSSGPDPDNRTRPGEGQPPQYDMVNREQRETFQAAVEDAEGIPRERRYLTDPPDTYREPAPTAPTEFEDIDDKDQGFFLTRWLTGG